MPKGLFQKPDGSWNVGSDYVSEYSPIGYARKPGELGGSVFLPQDDGEVMSVKAERILPAPRTEHVTAGPMERRTVPSFSPGIAPIRKPTYEERIAEIERRSAERRKGDAERIRGLLDAGRARPSRRTPPADYLAGLRSQDSLSAFETGATQKGPEVDIEHENRMRDLRKKWAERDQAQAERMAGIERDYVSPEEARRRRLVQDQQLAAINHAREQYLMSQTPGDVLYENLIDPWLQGRFSLSPSASPMESLAEQYLARLRGEMERPGSFPAATVGGIPMVWGQLPGDRPTNFAANSGGVGGY